MIVPEISAKMARNRDQYQSGQQRHHQKRYGDHNNKFGNSNNGYRNNNSNSNSNNNSRNNPNRRNYNNSNRGNNNISNRGNDRHRNKHNSKEDKDNKPQKKHDPELLKDAGPTTTELDEVALNKVLDNILQPQVVHADYEEKSRDEEALRTINCSLAHDLVECHRRIAFLQQLPMATPVLDSWIKLARKSVMNKDGALLRQIIQLEPPLSDQYKKMKWEIEANYARGRDADLSKRCDEIVEDLGSAWTHLPALIKQYFIFLRDFSEHNFKMTYNMLEGLLK